MSVDREYMRALEVQRRNFEAQFGSLETMGYEDKSKSYHDESEDSSNESAGRKKDYKDEGVNYSDGEEFEFNGFDSDGVSSESETSEEMDSGDEQVVPKVVKLNDDYLSSTTPILTKADMKLLKLGRAPTLSEIAKKEKELSKLTKKQQQKLEKEDSENLENDLKLQRLLQESHILASSLEYSGADVTLQTLDFEAPTGKARKRILDSRIRSLAATNSSTSGLPKSLEKMPMAMRKGMIKSRQHKIAKYEEDAKNAGIVLSKVKKGQLRDLDAGKGSTLASDRLGTGKKVIKRVRDRGLKINSVGRSTRNGLIISQQEIDKINGKGSNNKKRRR